MLALAGCFPGQGDGYSIEESKVPRGLGLYRTALVDVDARSAELFEGIEPLKTSLINHLSTLSCFDRYVSELDSPRADIRIAVTLIGASGVSSAERTLLGGLAGKPHVTADVRLTDLRSGSELGRFQVEGTTVGGSPTGYTTPEAYENAGAGIAEYIHLHR
jgi:hypothetical protein